MAAMSERMQQRMASLFIGRNSNYGQPMTDWEEEGDDQKYQPETLRAVLMKVEEMK